MTTYNECTKNLFVGTLNYKKFNWNDQKEVLLEQGYIHTLNKETRNKIIWTISDPILFLKYFIDKLINFDKDEIFDISYRNDKSESSILELLNTSNLTIDQRQLTNDFLILNYLNIDNENEEESLLQIDKFLTDFHDRILLDS